MYMHGLNIQTSVSMHTLHTFIALCIDVQLMLTVPLDDNCRFLEGVEDTVERF